MRLSLRRWATSVSGYLPKFAKVSRARGARRCPRPPNTESGFRQARAQCPCLLARAAAEAVQLRLLASRPREPPPPPPNLEPLSAPRRSAPSYSQTSVSQFESDPCSGAQSWASSFWKPGCGESEAPRLLHPRPAPRSPGPRVPRFCSRLPGKERRVTPGSRAGG